MTRSLAFFALCAACSTSNSATTGTTGAGVTTTNGATTGGAGTTTGTTGSTSGRVPTVSTLAGNGTPGFADGTGGPSGTAELYGPWAVAVDGAGNVYVADTHNRRIRKIDPDGGVTTLAGNGLFDGGGLDGTGGPTGTASFDGPLGLAVDDGGNVFVADTEGYRIRKIDASGNVTTVAGNGVGAFADGTGGPSGTAELWFPYSVAVDGRGNLVVADSANNRVRWIDDAGNVTTLAGDGNPNDMDGTGGSAELAEPTGVAVDSAGNVYVVDEALGVIRKIDGAGNVTTLNGAGPDGSDLSHPSATIAVDSAGAVYVSDTDSNLIQKLDAAGVATTLAGNGSMGFADGTGGPSGTASFSGPEGVAVDGAGNIYVADYYNNRVRVIRP